MRLTESEAFNGLELSPPEREVILTNVARFIAKVLAAEREACAKIADVTAINLITIDDPHGSNVADGISDAIRARGNKP